MFFNSLYFRSIALYLLILMKQTFQYKPIIGIYANIYPESDYSTNNASVIFGSYVRWLESLGAESLAIHPWYTHEYLDSLLSKINGVLFMGGGRDFNSSSLWEQTALYILKSSLSKPIPIWGTCLGFQLITFLLSEDNSIIKHQYNHMGYLDNITFTPYTLNSKMYSFLNKDDFESLLSRNATAYFHTWGVSEEDWNENEKLKNLFDVTGYGTDVNGKKFVSSFEGKENLIFGTQFHPEANPFVRYDGYEVEHSVDCLRISHKVGMAFVKYARMILNRMDYYERKEYDFINTYGKGNEDKYDKEDNAYFYFKKDN